MSDSGQLPDVDSIDAAIMRLLFPETQDDLLISVPPPAFQGQHRPSSGDGLQIRYRGEATSNHLQQRPQCEHHVQATRTLYSTSPMLWSAPSNPPQNRHHVSNSAAALTTLKAARPAKQPRPVRDAGNALALRRLEDAKTELSTPPLHHFTHPPSPLMPLIRK